MNNHDLIRFSSLYKVLDNGCWEWQGAIRFRARSSGGYGIFGVSDESTHYGRKRYKNKYAHQVSYEHYVGSVPVGLQLRHKCRYGRCVNPEHLVSGTGSDNARDEPPEDRKARSVAALNSMTPEQRKLNSQRARSYMKSAQLAKVK